MKNIIWFCLLFYCTLNSQNLPKGFSYLRTVDPSIQKEIRYLTTNNFIGTPIDGYIKDTLIVTTKTALALKKIQSIFK